MKMMKILALIACGMMLSLSQGFAKDAVNTDCPIKGKAIDGKSKTADVEVAFCCKKCKAAFDKDVLAGLQKFATAEDGKCPMSGKDVDDSAEVDRHCGRLLRRLQKEARRGTEEAPRQGEVGDKFSNRSNKDGYLRHLPGSRFFVICPFACRGAMSTTRWPGDCPAMGDSLLRDPTSSSTVNTGRWSEATFLHYNLRFHELKRAQASGGYGRSPPAGVRSARCCDSFQGRVYKMFSKDCHRLEPGVLLKSPARMVGTPPAISSASSSISRSPARSARLRSHKMVADKEQVARSAERVGAPAEREPQLSLDLDLDLDYGACEVPASLGAAGCASKNREFREHHLSVFPPSNP